jgi:biopolymer transport protein ExbB
MLLADIGGTLVGYFQKGGFVMYPLLALSILALIVILERGFTLYIRSRTKTGELVTKVRKFLRDDNPEGGVKACDQYRGPTAAIVKAALLRWDSGREEMEKLLENAAINEIARLERWLWVLGLIANIAPILGFLGTVVGMIQSFDVIARQGLNNPGLVAQGISVALITTASGLIVAVFTLPFYNFFMTKVAAYIREMETTANIVMEAYDQTHRQS